MQKHRFEELEGLRGIAAVMVAVYHFLLAFYAIYFFGTSAGQPQHMRLEDNLYGNPLTVFTSGTFAVAIFFVLSGFVLSIGFFRSKSVESVKKLALKRYPRLMLPALASVIIAFAIMTFGIAMIQQVGAVTGSQWLLTTWGFTPHFWNAIYQGTYGIFVSSGSAYNNVLWTMTIEFAGSFLVFGFMALFGTFKHRWILYIALGIITFNTWFMAFILGMLLADLYASGRIMQKARRWLLVVPVLVIALYLGGYPAPDGGPLPFYDFLSPTGMAINWRTLYLTIGATLLVGAVVMVAQISRQFAKKRFSILGRYTFSLYLVHLMVLYTFGMWEFMIPRLTWIELYGCRTVYRACICTGGSGSCVLI